MHLEVLFLQNEAELSTVLAFLKIKQCPLKILIFVGFFVCTLPVLTEERFFLDNEVLSRVEKKYGSDARVRLVDWQRLILRENSDNDGEKLSKVNAFFNRMEFVDDISLWGKEDYWATPVEFLARRAGDCEDFALAKYFTLVAMGISESQLSLTYVKSLRLNRHHMVLTYYRVPGSEPLVLDNLTSEVKKATERTDLLPIYSFNGTSLWLAKQRGRGVMVGSSQRLSRWQDLLQRMPKGLLETNHYVQ